MDSMDHKKIRWGRRSFIQNSLAAAAGLGLAGQTMAELKTETSKKKDLEIKEYRTLGRTGFKVSDISFGAGNLNNPDVLHAALELGINYIDTAEHYARGNSERTIGEVIKNHDRKKLFITSKLNFAMGGSTKQKLKDRFMKCLERLQTDYIDCFMIHMTPTADQIKHEPYHELITELKAEGKVHYSGLSNHGTEHKLAGPIKDEMEKVVLAAAEDGRFDVVLFVYNFIQKDQGEKILKACREKNMGTTLMKVNPVKFYDDVQEQFAKAEEAGRKIPPAYLKWLEEYKTFSAQAEAFKQKYGLNSKGEIRDAAVRFALDHPDVHAICPTLNNFEDLEAYVSLSGTRFEETEQEMLAEYTDRFAHTYCRHACNQCEPSCPHGVPVNTIMRYHHYFAAQHREKYAMEKYHSLKNHPAACCTSCPGYCEQACPHNVPIQGLLLQADLALSLS
jgi:predicted aldo/keto reductase-like oxidoreductase